MRMDQDLLIIALNLTLINIKYPHSARLIITNKGNIINLEAVSIRRIILSYLRVRISLLENTEPRINYLEVDEFLL